MAHYAAVPRFTAVWSLAFWLLLGAWILGAGLNLAHVRGGFLTDYLADTAFPPWYYILLRGLHRADGRRARVVVVGDWFGRTPARAALSIFAVGFLSELKTKYWPHGIITGTYDPLDLVAYAAGLVVCVAFDRAAGEPPASRPANSEAPSS